MPTKSKRLIKKDEIIETAIDTFPLSKMEYDDQHAKISSILAHKNK